MGLRSKMYSILTVQPDGALKEKQDQGRAKEGGDQRPASRVPGGAEEGSERRAAFAQLRSRAHEIAVETVKKKSLSPFNDKVYGLDAHNSPLGYAPPPRPSTRSLSWGPRLWGPLRHCRRG